MARRQRPTPLDRFWAKVSVRGPNDCWPWMGGKTAGGYGRAQFRNRRTLASRLAYEITYDVVLPREVLVCHHCDNPPCCNPTHLFVGSHSENAVDAVTKGRWPSRPTCPKGHRYDDPDTLGIRIGKKGRPYRYCRRCNRERLKARRHG